MLKLPNYLNALNVDDIEVMIVSHPHSDHIGGLDIVLENFIIEAVYAPEITNTTDIYEDFLNAVALEGLTLKTVKAGVEYL